MPNASQPEDPIVALDTFDDTGKTVRRILVDGTWYYSIIDVVGLLSASVEPRKYWYDMKRRMRAEGAVEVSAKCRQLKLPAADGKFYKTDCCDRTYLFRIIQAIPSPNAEPVKLWLATLGDDEMSRLERNQALTRMSEEERRVYIRDQVSAHNQVVAERAERSGVLTRHQHAVFNGAGYRGLYDGETAASIHERKRLKRSHHILDWMNARELSANLFRLEYALDALNRANVAEPEAANEMHYRSGQIVREAIRQIGGTLPEEETTPSESVRQVRARLDQAARQPALFPAEPER